MKLSDQERAELRASFATMSLSEKLEHIFAYYKFPIVLAVIALTAVGSVIHARVTHKDAVLYAAYANVSVGDTLDAALNEGFVRALGGDPRKSEVCLYRKLYLSRDAATESHEYAYASQLKVMASIANRQMDVMFMNREAYDVMSSGGYLLPLDDLLARNAALRARVAGALTENTVILKDNDIEYRLNEADTYRAVTESAVNGILISGFPLFERASFSGEVFLGVIGNSERQDAVLRYIDYMTTDLHADA